MVKAAAVCWLLMALVAALPQLERSQSPHRGDIGRRAPAKQDCNSRDTKTKRPWVEFNQSGPDNCKRALASKSLSQDKVEKACGVGRFCNEFHEGTQADNVIERFCYFNEYQCLAAYEHDTSDCEHRRPRGNGKLPKEPWQNATVEGSECGRALYSARDLAKVDRNEVKKKCGTAAFCSAWDQLDLQISLTDRFCYTDRQDCLDSHDPNPNPQAPAAAAANDASGSREEREAAAKPAAASNSKKRPAPK